MRRSTLTGILALLLVVITSAGVMARPAATFVARAGHAEQGGSLLVKAKVKHPVKGTSYSASAVVHLASGDVSVDLRRAGRSFVALARVPVPADEAPGIVVIDVTITYGAVAQLVTAEGVVTIAEPDEV